MQIIQIEIKSLSTVICFPYGSPLLLQELKQWKYSYTNEADI